MPSNAENQHRQAQKKVVDLQKKIGAEAKKLGSAHQKLQAARRSTLKSAPALAAKYHKEISKIESDKAKLEEKLATAQEQAHKTSIKVTEEASKQSKKDAEKANKRLAVEKTAWRQERQNLEAQIRIAIQERAITRRSDEIADVTQYDFFISHASDDKEGFVRDFATELERQGATVWYDEATLKIGDSLRRSIDRGLASSRFGVVVLSEAFFRKEWPQRELDGLTALEVTDGGNRILPIWHKVSKDEVAKFSPVLADRLALNTSLKSIHEIAIDLMELLPDRGD